MGKKTEWERIAENLVRHLPTKTLYLRAKVGGKPIRKSLDTKSVKVAKIKRDELLSKLRAKAGRIKNQKGAVTLTASIELLRSYYGSLPSYQAKPQTHQYRNQLIEVLARTLPDKPPSNWNETDLQLWWSAKEVANFSPSRRNGLLDTLRKLIELLIDRGVIFDDPARKLSRVKVKVKEVKIPSAVEFQNLVADIRSQKKRVSEESANFVEFLAYSGCRIDEARGIRGSDILEDRIRVRGGEYGTKNHEVRYVPIISRMRDLLERLEISSDDGQLFSLHSPRFAIKNACERLKIPHCTPHTFRHLFTTTCLESGVDFPTVARWLGHKDGGALLAKTYSHLRDEHSLLQATKVQF